MITPLFAGQIINGRLALNDKPAFETYLTKLTGRVQIKVERPKRYRTNPENRYYWGVIVKSVADAMHLIIPEEAHDYLKSLFLKTGVDVNGKRYEIIRSTTALTTTEFEDYLERCQMWASKELQIVIPLPNEVEILI